MDLEAFKTELVKAEGRLIKIGWVLFLICVAICSLIFIFSDLDERSPKAGLIIAGGIGLVGVFMIVSSYVRAQQVKSEEHELIRAIKNKEDYIVWVYQHTTLTKHHGTSSEHFHLIAYTKHGKRLQFMPKAEYQVQEMIHFLTTQFPRAVIGYSEENRMLVSKTIGKNIKA